MPHEVETNKGRIIGVETESAFVFKGIPYAKPPVGDLRFRPPQQVEPWYGLRMCDEFAPMSIQKKGKPDSFYGKEFFSYPEYDVPMSEDGTPRT